MEAELVDTKSSLSGENFAGELQQNSLVTLPRSRTLHGTLFRFGHVRTGGFTHLEPDELGECKGDAKFFV